MILPPKTNVLAGTLMGLSEGWRQGLGMEMLKKQWNMFLDAYVGRQNPQNTGGAGIGGATGGITESGMNYSPEYGIGVGLAPGPTTPIMQRTPGQMPAMGGGMGAPQRMGAGQQQNPLMGILSALGGMGRGAGAGLQGMGRGIAGMFGGGQQPNALGGNAINTMFGRGGIPTGGVNPMAAMMGGGQQGPLAGGQGGIDPRMLIILKRLLGGGQTGVPQGMMGL